MSENLIVSIVGIAIALVTLGALFWQTRRQTKVNSARFTIDYIDHILEKNKETVDIILKRSKGEEIEFNDSKDVRILLNGIENIIQFVNDGVIHKKHMLNDLEVLLKAIKKDKEVQRIKKIAQNDHSTVYRLIDDFTGKEID